MRSAARRLSFSCSGPYRSHCKTRRIDHVGIGSDFDGIQATVSDLASVADLPNLTRELLRRGYSEADVDKILGGNMLRVMEEVARKLAFLPKGAQAHLMVSKAPKFRKPRIGFHAPIKGGLHDALVIAKEIGCDTVQLFSRNPRGWMAKPLTKIESIDSVPQDPPADKLSPVMIHCKRLGHPATRIA